MNSNPDFFKQFTLVIATQVGPLGRSSQLHMQPVPPLVVVLVLLRPLPLPLPLPLVHGCRPRRSASSRPCHPCR